MITRLKRSSLPAWTYPLLLLGLVLLAYGLLLPWLGYYWDEWPLTWIGQRLGSEGLQRYFSTNRPFWGLIYRFTMPLLGETPWHWQLFGLFWRWLSAVLFWGILKYIFPCRPDLAAGAGVLFLLYPGFSQQSGGLMYGHFFMVICAWLGSMLAGLAALSAWPVKKTRFAALIGLALLLELANLLTMEYFFLLELLRPILYFLYFSARTEPPGSRGISRRAFRFSLAFLLLFSAAAAWRGFFFQFQTQNYEASLLERISDDPLNGILGLLGTALTDLAEVTTGALLKTFTIPNPSVLGIRSFLVYVVAAAAAGLFCLTGFLLLRLHSSAGEAPAAKTARRMIFLSLPALLLAGIPFWVTDLPVGLNFPNNRFTLPFMAGFALLVTGLIALLPGRSRSLTLIISLVAGLTAGQHFEEASAYRRDWSRQQALFWQMSWRIPALEPGTTLVSSNLPLPFYSDNSLAGPLNWIYAPANRSVRMDYMFYFASIRAERKLLFKPGQPIDQDYLAASFHGSTAQLVALVFNPPACLRILDPELDPLNYMLPEIMRPASELSSSRWILPEGSQPLVLTPSIFGQEPAHAWCYYYEQAALAAGQADWARVVELGETAFNLGDYPNDPMERLPFIEGYAHTGNWPRALQLSVETAAITPLMQPMLCKLWQRIEREAVPAPPDVIAQARADYCP